METCGLGPDCIDSFHSFNKYLSTVDCVRRHQGNREQTDTILVLKSFTYTGRQTLIKHKHTCVNCDECREGTGQRVPCEGVVAIRSGLGVGNGSEELCPRECDLGAESQGRGC